MIDAPKSNVQQVIDISGYLTSASHQMSSTAQQISQRANEQFSAQAEKLRYMVSFFKL